MLSFRYAAGNAVQLAPRTPIRQVIWRGEQRVQFPDGSWYAKAVYCLDDNYWDCYFEDELHAALRWNSDDYRSPFQANPYS